MNQFYVYLYRDEKGTPIYVGKGKGTRAKRHLNRKDKHPFVQKIQKMIREGHNPQPEFLIKEVDEEFALFAEEEAIRKYGRKDLGTGTLLNLTDGGEGNSGWNPSKETRTKMKENNLGKTLSSETREKISSSLLKKGWVLTTARLDNFIGMRKGSIQSNETRAKISAAKKGRTLSIEHREALSIAAKEDWARRKLIKKEGQ